MRLQLTSPFLNSSPRCCSWASSVQRFAQLPNMRRPEISKYTVRQLNKGVSLFFSIEIRSPNVKHGYDNVFTLGQSSCVCDHSFEQRLIRCLCEVLVSVTATTTELLGNPPSTQLGSVIGPLIDSDPSGANDTAPFLRCSGSRNNVIDSHLVYEVFLFHFGTMDQNWVEFFAMPNCPQDATFVFLQTLPGVFSLQTAIAATGSSYTFGK